MCGAVADPAVDAEKKLFSSLTSAKLSDTRLSDNILVYSVYLAALLFTTSFVL